jgi:hypothetical protein
MVKQLSFWCHIMIRYTAAKYLAGVVRFRIMAGSLPGPERKLPLQLNHQ